MMNESERGTTRKSVSKNACIHCVGALEENVKLKDEGNAQKVMK